MTTVPDRGDVVRLAFDPQAGHEQAGHRPALVLSPAKYNRRSGLALMCPVTSRRKGHPFEVVLPPAMRTRGVILSDQVKSLDWRARLARVIETAPLEVTEDVLAKLATLIGPT